MPDLDNEEFSPEELAEAAELARDLEGGSHVGEASPALEAAALLRVSQNPVLTEARFQELRAELPTRAVPEKSEPRRARSFWDLFFSGLGLRWTGFLVPTALLIFVVVRSVGVAPEPALSQRDVGLPKPSLALLKAQARALSGAEAPEYEAQMAAYRGQVLASLEGRRTRGGP